MAPLVERRMFARLEQSFSGWCSIKDARELNEFYGVNFSAAGLGVTTAEQIPEGRALDVWLVNANTKIPIYATGQVVWQRKVDSGRWYAGLKFFEPALTRLLPLINQRN